MSKNLNLEYPQETILESHGNKRIRFSCCLPGNTETGLSSGREPVAQLGK